MSKLILLCLVLIATVLIDVNAVSLRRHHSTPSMYQSLPGSSWAPMTGATISEMKISPDERMESTILIRRQNVDQFNNHLDMIQRGLETHLTRAEFEARYGASAEDMALIEAFAASHNLVVVQQNSARRTMILSGTVEQMSAAFRVPLLQFEYAEGTYRGYEGEIQIPVSLAGIIEYVLGLDNRPVASPRAKIVENPLVSYNALQVAAIYNFPKGTGSKTYGLAIIELGGGYRPADLTAYWTSIGVSPAPNVVAVGVDGARNNPTGNPNSADGEVLLDIEIAGSIASSANIVVYFGPNTDAGFLDAITTAAHDTTYTPCVISISWGDGEYDWSASSMKAFDSAFQAAAILGVASFAASGDDGSSDGGRGSNVDFPASSTYVTGCGGTSLTTNSEVTWSGSGGGVSTVFPLPSWQVGLVTTDSKGVTSPLKMRGVPDIASNADPNTGYDIRVDGRDYVIGGTSAAAPLWASLVAVNTAIQNKYLGSINPILYAAQQSLNDIVKGNNGAFEASVGWDACTGWGTPNATLLK